MRTGPARCIGLPGRLALVLCLSACAPQTQTDSRATVHAWLSCIECVDGELDSLKAAAGRSAGVVDTLRDALILGPRPSLQAQLTLELTSTYQQVANHLAGPTATASLPFTQAEFVSRYLENMIVIYQGRAAYGLGAIGGFRARQALDSALQFSPDSFPPNVWAQIHFARDSLIGP